VTVTTCPECGNQIDAGAIACPECGRPSAAQLAGARKDHTTLASDLMGRWNALTDQARASLARQLIKTAASEIDPQKLNRGQLWSLVSHIASGRQITTTLAGEPIRYPYKIARPRAARVTFTVLGVLLFASVMPRVHADDNTTPGIIPCARLFVTGDQLYAVQWANKNLFKSACMAPQPTAETATYILELRSDPALVRSGLTSGTIPVAPDNFSVNCYSIGASTTCKDSSGAAYTTTCHVGRFGVECDTYNGVGMAEALVMLPFQILLRNSARAYLFDATTNVLVWKYDGDRPWDREFAYAGQCVKEKRAGVWGVPD
jgi:hypothetical protein